MFTLRKGVIVSLGMFAGVGMNAAQACDNDRFPCPVVSEAVTQETAAAPAEPVQVAQPPKKASQSARPATKLQPTAEQSMPRTKGREASLAARTTSKTAPQKQQAAPIPRRMIPRQRRRYLLLRSFSRRLRVNRPRKIIGIKLWWPLPGRFGQLLQPSIVPPSPRPPLWRQRNQHRSKQPSSATDPT